MCPGGKCSSLPGYFSGQELQCKKSRSSEAQRSPKSFCKGPQAKSIRWLSCSWFSCAGRRAHRMFWIRDLNCCHVSAQTVLKSRGERTKSECPNRKTATWLWQSTEKIPLPVLPTLPSSRLKTKPATANLFHCVHLFQRPMISFYACKKPLSGIFCLLRNQTQGQAISGYQRSDTGSRRKCWSHSTEERNRSLIGCAQTRSSFQQELMPTKLWLKSSDHWVLGTGLYTHLHRLGILCWASFPGRKHSLKLSGRPEESFLFWL